jgi:hypothetical protein
VHKTALWSPFLSQNGDQRRCDSPERAHNADLAGTDACCDRTVRTVRLLRLGSPATGGYCGW